MIFGFHYRPSETVALASSPHGYTEELVYAPLLKLWPKLDYCSFRGEEFESLEGPLGGKHPLVVEAGVVVVVEANSVAALLTGITLITKAQLGYTTSVPKVVETF